MTTKEVLCELGDKIESNADSYRNLLENGAEVTLMEKTDDGKVVVTIRKEA